MFFKDIFKCFLIVLVERAEHTVLPTLIDSMYSTPRSSTLRIVLFPPNSTVQLVCFQTCFLHIFEKKKHYRYFCVYPPYPLNVYIPQNHTIGTFTRVPGRDYDRNIYDSQKTFFYDFYIKFGDPLCL